MAGVIVRVLGPTEVVVDGELVALRRRERAVLAALALGEGPVSAAEVAQRIWDPPPPTAAKSLHNHVRRLRAGMGRPAVDTIDGGYRLRPSVGLDLQDLKDLLATGRQAAAAGDHDQAAASYGAALRLRRGVPFADLGSVAAAEAGREEWEELLRLAGVELAANLLRGGNAEAAVAQLEAQVRTDPYRDRTWSLLALGLYRTGRRRDSLRMLDRARQAAVGVGLTPGRELAELEQRVLADDPSLLLVEPTDRQRLVRPEPSGARRSVEIPRHDAARPLVAAWEDARASGRAGARVVVGEPGVGKTALARQVSAIAAAGGAVVAWGSCDPTPVAPLAPVSSVLADLAEEHGRRTLARTAGDLRRALDVLLDGAAMPTAAPARLADAAVTTIAGLARLRPVLVVVDDLQWALPTTRRVLERLTGIDAPLLVLGTSRTATDLVGAVAHTLRGLHQDEVEQLAGGLLGRPVSPTLAAALHERTGGNPMFVRQLLAGSSGATPDSELLEAIATALPRRTIDAVREHLADLSASARRVMAAAAVIGRPERELLELLVGPCERELEEARAAGLLVAADGELSFAHALHREAAEASIPVGVRLELHDAAGRVLAQHRPGAVDEIAHHHLEAAAIDPDAARAAALAAARARAAAHAHREAADMYAAARGLVEPARHSDGEWLDVGIEHGECLRLTGDPAGRAVLWDVAHRALEVSDDDRFGRAVLCLCRLGMTTEAGEVDEPVRELAERALTQTSDDVVRAELAGAMSLLLSFDGDPGRCRSMFLGAESIARSVGDPALIGRVLPFAYLGLARREDIDRRSEIAEELVGLGDRAGDHLALFEGLHLRFAVRVQRAERGFERDLARMREIVERQDDVGRTWAVGYCSAVVAHLAGDLDEADALNEATLARATAGIAASRALAVYGAQLLGLRTDQQRLAELVPLLTPLVDAQPGVPAWRAALAASSAAAGDRATARAMVDELASDGFGGLPHDAVRSAALHQAGAAVVTLGDVARARAVVDALVPWSGRMSWAGTCTLGAIDQVLGELLALLGQPSAARRHLRKAATMGRRLRAPLVTERAERALAALA